MTIELAILLVALGGIFWGRAIGALSGEWKGASRKPRGTMVIGIVILFIAFVMLGYANQLLANH